jgi:hypothetical protein
VAPLLGQTASSGTGGDAALLEQVKQMASKGQNAETVNQINQYVAKNHDLISTIIKLYTDYLKRIQGMADGKGNIEPGMPNPMAAQETGTGQSTGNNQAAVSPQANATGPSKGQRGASSQTDLLGPDDVLITAHLPGYPALPEVDPVSSIMHPTIEQLEYAKKVQDDMQTRKAYLMEHPNGYSY